VTMSESKGKSGKREVEHSPAVLSAPAADGNGAQVARRRLLGAYYTPESLAAILVAWALDRETGTVLDPSYGGCSFLSAAVANLREKGVRRAGRLVFGVDIDSSCVEYARNGSGLVERNCVTGNFLALSPDDLPGSPFHAIVGNPPFVRHHWLGRETRLAARSLVDESAMELAATASTWAYFLLHALSFLDAGGRLAMLVPEAILQADYATAVRRRLRASFTTVKLIHLRDRIFEGTDEPVVVVAASGFGQKGALTVEAVESAEDLIGVLDGGSSVRWNGNVIAANGRRVSKAVLSLLERIERLPETSPLSKLATVRIGFVTGANNFFIRSADGVKKLDLPSRTRLPVVTRTKWLSGLEFTAADHRALAQAGRRAFLIRPTPAYEEHDGVLRWIELGKEAGIHQRTKCAARSPWFRVKLPASPDAFGTCTRLGSPLVVLNRTRHRCSNALHALWWNRSPAIEPEAVAVGFLTSAVSVWAELYGRRYGGGVLKLEPGTLNRVPVPVVLEAAEAFPEISELLRSGQEEEARRRADHVVLDQGLGLSDTEIKRLQRARRQLMSQRRPVRNGDQRA